MALLEWTDNLDVGVPKMNDEHLELIRLMNAVYDANAARSGSAVIGRALDDLVRYTAHHFRDEEAYMDSIGFAGASSHKLIHKDLLARVGKFVADFTNSRAQQLDDEFFKFLRFWLLSHIQGIDTKYAVAAAPPKAAARR